uniref:Glycosyltransferase RgtA/B/C/D-like domain-containing protein n=1 Tax=Eiseniibacteriota bacterium TaxID=2212470 RepID=A0A832I6C3_UNCEI
MTWSRPWPLVLAVLAALAATAGRLPAPAAVVAIAVTFGFTPGWIAARHLAPGARPAFVTLLALVVSPLLVGGPAAAALALGAAPAAVARALAWTLAALALVPPPLPSEQQEPETAVPWLAGGAWVAVTLAFLIGNGVLVTRADGWFHAAVVTQIVQRGMPVEDPFFAGLKLLYHWGYHLRAALWLVLAPGLSVWAPLLSPQVAGALATMIGLTLLAQRLGADARGQAAAAALAVFGYVPFGWLWLLLRAAFGEARGAEELARMLGGGATTVLEAMSPGALGASLSFFGDKFFVPTPFALGYAAFLAFVLVLLDLIERPRLRGWVLLALVQAAALFLHPVLGWANLLMAAGWGAWTLARARRPWERYLRVALVGLALAAAAAVVLVFPYLRVTSAGEARAVSWGLSAAAARTWLLAGGLFVLPGMLWLARRSAAPGPARELWGLAIALTCAALLLHLPAGHQSKLFNLLFVLLAAPAALKLVVWWDARRGARRAAMAAFLAIATLPTVALSMWGFASESLQRSPTSEAPRHASVREAYAWAARHTPADAVFVDPEERLGMAVIAGRSALWGGERWVERWGYAEAGLARRRRAVLELSRGEVSEETRRLLRELGRPVVLVHRKFRHAGDAARLAAPSKELWSLLYENEGVALYRWRAGP